jgi:hypothetical protein
MRVLHVPFTFHPDPCGGTDIYVAALCEELGRLGVTAVVAAASEAEGCYQSGTLTVRQKALVLREYADVLRGSRLRDAALFDEVLAKVRSLEPGWLPWDRPRVCKLARIFGYRAAEGIALRLIAARRWLNGGW